MPTVVIEEDQPLTGVLLGSQPGTPGPVGPTGPSGAGVPVGGTTGQLLAKHSNTSNDTEWIDPADAGSGITTTDTATIDFSGDGDTVPISAIVKANSITAALVAADVATQAELDTQGQPTGGTTGQVLSKINATNFNSQWVTLSGTGAVDSVNGRIGTVIGLQEGQTLTALKTGTYTANANDYVICDTTSAGFTVTLPTAPANGTRVTVDITAGANTVTVSRGGSDVIGKPTGGFTSRTVAGTPLKWGGTYYGGTWYETIRVATAQNIVNVPSGTTSSTNVQAAIDEIAGDIAALNSVAAGTNITLDAPSGGHVNVNVDPAAAALWTPTIVTAASDQSVTSNTSVVDDTEIVFAFTAGQTYDVVARLLMQGNPGTANGQMKVNWSASGGTAAFDYVYSNAAHNSWAGTGNMAVQAGFALTLASADQSFGTISPATTSFMLLVHGTLVAGATGGTLKFRFAQKTSDAVATTRKAGSRLIIRRLV